MRYGIANVLPLHGGCCGREGEERRQVRGKGKKK